MEGKKTFDYENAKDRTTDKSAKQIILKVLQVAVGVIMAILHM